MLPHDPDLAVPHHEDQQGGYADDGFAATDRRPVRAWMAVAAILGAAAIVLVLWWLLVADDDAETGDVTSAPAAAVLVV